MKKIDYEIDLELYQIYEIIGSYFYDFGCYSNFEREFNSVVSQLSQKNTEKYNYDNEIYSYDDIEIVYYNDGTIDEVKIDFKLLLLNQYISERIRGVSSIPNEIHEKINSLTKEIDNYYHYHNSREITDIKYVRRFYFDD